MIIRASTDVGLSDTNGVEGGPARIVLADDDALVRAGVASLLEHGGHEVVAQVGDASALLAVVREQRPDLLVLDLRMPPSEDDVRRACHVIRRELPEVGILVLSAYAEAEIAKSVLAYGRGTGYLLKSSVAEPGELLGAIDRVLRGGSFIDPVLVQELFAARRTRDPLASLSAREREVLELMAEGLSNAGIGQRLWITESTVEKHVRSILAKLDLRDTGDVHRRVLAVIAYLDGR